MKNNMNLTKSIRILIVLTISFFTYNNSYSQSNDFIIGKVIGISDGDTFSLLLEKDNFEIRVRLNHIDCPEKKQPYSQKAKKKLSDLIFGKQCKVYYSKKDGYGRVLGTVFINNVNINEEMVKSGFAWHFKKYSDSKIFSDLEINARKLKLGLWQDPNPISPWEWRNLKKSKKM